MSREIASKIHSMARHPRRYQLALIFGSVPVTNFELHIGELDVLGTKVEAALHFAVCTIVGL